MAENKDIKDEDGNLPSDTEPDPVIKARGQRAVNLLHNMVKGKGLKIEEESPRYNRKSTSANKARTSDGTSRVEQGLDES